MDTIDSTLFGNKLLISLLFVIVSILTVIGKWCVGISGIAEGLKIRQVCVA